MDQLSSLYLKKGDSYWIINKSHSTSCIMFPSAISDSRDSSPWIQNDSSPEPTMCSCQNQLGHWDWNGVPHKDLLELCKKTMAMGEDALTSQKDGENMFQFSPRQELRNLEDGSDNGANGDTSATESDREWDPEWEHGKTNLLEI